MNAVTNMHSLTFSHHLLPSTRRLSPSPATRISTTRTSSTTSVAYVRTFNSISLSTTSPSLVNNETKFLEASKNWNLVPLCRCIFSDQLTPVLAYRCLVREDDREAPSFLFESVEPGHRASNVGRYSVVGAQPVMEIVAKENKVTIMDHEKGTLVEEFVEDPMVIPRRISEEWKPQLIDDLPDAFCGGWVGYFSYDTVRYVEKKKLPFEKAPHDDRHLADIHLGLYDNVIVFDHVEKKAYVIHWVRLDHHSSVENAYKEGVKRLEKLVAKVQDIDPPRLSPGSVNLQTRQFGPSLKKSNMTCDAYKNAVIQAKEHILAWGYFSDRTKSAF
ncbi:hypothetical protein Dsin_000543 [Dipteronia sinensis]|uniref:Anthranilate synthase component I N-terminal domain-containing protein n=1 Tax=Dipteronia sinensis TaxID=43782 RepID=A0AAE0B2K8_9ROSI|nr:hypothetical protein Dsin_000543 [Dipteronia sinensis]